MKPTLPSLLTSLGWTGAFLDDLSKYLRVFMGTGIPARSVAEGLRQFVAKTVTQADLANAVQSRPEEYLTLVLAFADLVLDGGLEILGTEYRVVGGKFIVERPCTVAPSTCKHSLVPTSMPPGVMLQNPAKHVDPEDEPAQPKSFPDPSEN